MHASTFEVAALNVVDLLPFVLFSLPAAVWVDRLRRRPLMIAADWGRAASLTSIPLAYALHGLTLPQLFLVGFATSTLTVVFDVSYQSYRRAEVLPEALATARRRMREEIAEGLRYVVGHPIMRPMMVFVAVSNFFSIVLLHLPRLRGARPTSVR